MNSTRTLPRKRKEHFPTHSMRPYCLDIKSDKDITGKENNKAIFLIMLKL